MRIGGLQGLAGEFDAARASIREGRSIMDDLGLQHQKAHSSDVAVLVEMLAEDYEAAVREASTAYEILVEMGDLPYQAEEALLMAEALEQQGRTDEAEHWVAVADSNNLDDPDSLVVKARLLARRGRLEEAIQTARLAVDRCPELPVPFADARFTLAQLLARAGRDDEAAAAAEACLRRYEAKGIVPLVRKANELLSEVRS
jgi:tetratricopeptide (TPR) repeat protein